MPLAFIIAVGLLLAFANGANDNPKGVATLVGAGAASYPRAIGWATLATLAGSVAAFFLAGTLLTAFSGSGLVSAHTVADPRYPLAVASGAAGTVLLATRLGFPVSTTHALIGALVGAGWVAGPGELDVARLGGVFVLPLVFSPMIAAVAAFSVYPALSWVRRRLGLEHDSCACVATGSLAAVMSRISGSEQAEIGTPTVFVASEAACRVGYAGRVMGITAGPVLDAAHYLSAGAVSFARGLNDTPKIAALMLAGGLVAPAGAIVGVAAAMCLGAVLAARRVAETMSYRITGMNPGQGFTANVVTAGIVTGASVVGLSVSTTHVSCGALFGIGAATSAARWRTVAQIVGAWIVTLPIAAALGGMSMKLL